MNTWLVYSPKRDLEITPSDVGLRYEDVTFAAADGLKLHAWFVPAGPPAAPRPADEAGTVLFCHGNAGNISHRTETILLHHQLGMNVLVFDYRGYGKSEGRPTEKGTYLDAEAAWKYLVEVRHIPPARIVVHGRSLGGSVAAHLAQGCTPAGLVVEASFYDITELGAELYRFLPVRWISRMKYTTAEYVRGATCPVMVIHSSSDELIAIHHGRTIFDAAPQPKRFLEIHGEHNGAFVESDSIYRPAMRQFLADVLTPAAVK